MLSSCHPFKLSSSAVFLLAQFDLDAAIRAVPMLRDVFEGAGENEDTSFGTGRNGARSQSGFCRPET